MPSKQMNDAQEQAQAFEPVAFRAGTGDGAVLVAEELPASSPLPDVQPYLRDVVIGRNPLTHEPITERRMTLDTAKQFLLDCPRVQVFVPPDTSEEIENPSRQWTIPVTWQGVKMMVPKCRPALVPMPIAEILAHKAEPLRTAQAKSKAIYVTEISAEPNQFGMVGPEIRVQ